MNIGSIETSIKALSDAYAAKGLERASIVFPEPTLDVQSAANNFIDAVVLTEALNDGWKPDFSDPAQERFSITWEMRPQAANGPGFSVCRVNQDPYNLTTAGAHFVFHKRETALYAATRFAEVYRHVMTLPNALI